VQLIWLAGRFEMTAFNE